MKYINKGKCFKTKIILKRIILLVCFIDVVYLLGCTNKQQREKTAYDRIPKKEEIVVPIKFPKLPYELKYNIKSVSWNINHNSLISNMKGKSMKVSTEETTRKKPIGHKIEGAKFYYEEPMYEKKVVTPENTSNEEYLKSLYGTSEIVKFNNQIYKNEKNRCSGNLYYQIRIISKGKKYVKPKFKIKNAEGLVMEVFMERYPDLSNLNENEVAEGHIVVSDQEYSDTYELIIEE